MSYLPPEPDAVFVGANGEPLRYYSAESLQAAHAAGRASRDAEVEALKTELREGDDLRTRLSTLITRSVNAIRGEPEPLGWHSWHDLPELVEALRADAERLDWLTEQGKKTIFNWFARDSLVNRGYRLHQGHGIGSATPREAIDAAITAARAAQEKQG